MNRNEFVARLGKDRAWSVGALALLGTIAFLPSLVAPFFADDYFHVYEAAQPTDAMIHGWVLPIGSAGTWWTPPDLAVEYFRPLVVLSFALDRLLYGLHPAGYHLTNLAMHAAGTVLAWAIARRLLGPGYGAWSSATVFAIHPCHVQGVGWISGRTDVLAALLYMAALFLYLESRARPRDAATLVAASLAMFSLALLAKEMAITFPAVVLAHELLRPGGRSLARRLTVPALAAGVAAAYLMLRMSVLGGFHSPPTPFAFHTDHPGELVRHLLTAPLIYLGDLVLFVPGEPMVTVPFWRAHPFLFFAFAALALATVRGTVRRIEDRGHALWALVFTAITLLPVMILPIEEHFLYLPSLGYCVLVGSQFPASLELIPESERRALNVVGILVLTVCLVRTIVFERVAFASQRTINQAAAAIDRFPRAKLVLVTDLPAGASLAFSLGLNFVRPTATARVEILSILPSMLGGGERSHVTVEAPDRIALSRDDGFLRSYIERALAGPRTSFREGETFPRDGHSVTVTSAPEGRLQAFRTQLDDPAHTIVLGESDRGMIPLAEPSP